MAESHVTTVLPVPHEAAWKVLSDLSRFEEWLTIHDAWKSDLPELAEGARVTEQLSVMGMTNKIDWTVMAHEPPSTLKISGTGMAGAQITFTLSVAPEGDGSLVTIDAEFSGQMVVGAIGAAVERSTTTALEESLAKLTELVA